MIRTDQCHESDRGVSIALTHVLTIGITTILIAMLLMAGSTMLDSQTERSTQSSLETVGERLAGEIDNVDRIANNSSSDTVTVVADHPRTVANSGYSVELLAAGTCGSDAPLLDGSTPCLELSSQGSDVTVHVPVVIDEDFEAGTPVAGGPIEIAYDGDEIALEEAER